ncbi:N-acetylmuramoyl-L-alanine amidase family protein [Listeria monocytogenes]|uniref:peptidoglycan recognition protein family protein n=3 Tax=Listeria monocytogenes TaxID=1639 RepID=UPI00083DD7F4|nr:N-acetylmuramoyl-L-alanine amidase family protein [Listeria monocytogenes]EAC6276633.1 N-acetylmuramoyl-L-alanine amidase family protein [Listeria monocytogenes]EAC6755351.1 N-acetylmuramoyl-L-alanine amidase family protein [Listeria monocytogenes]EAC8423349.1 N-acetylmuramoyl-L-alanine amidase family protein [Listeria monocytogenes]EAC9740099.1 N-acetylmuramoyl-L-alanine amidase family protein [Listeria monocytogenes]EAC9745605.1 N-acetylmuramoyl-L-alanine amidase family protein [Listeria 
MSVLQYNYINKNQFSRPGYKLLRVSKIVMHYTANPGASADNHRRYFRDLKDRYASAHIFIDDKEAICIIPLNEVAYHANERSCKLTALQASTSYYRGGNANLTSIGIEMCLDKNGNITAATFNRSVDVAAELCKTYDLTASDIIRHYDVTGKNCPAPWVAKPSELTRFRNAVNAKLKGASQNKNRHDGKIVDSAPLLPKMDFKSNPARMYKSGTEFLVYEHNQYWYKTYIDDKLYYMYKSFCDVVAKKDAKGRIKVRIKSAKDLRIPVWNNTKLNSGKIKWYAPNTKLAWYDNKKGFLELWYEKDGWYYTSNYFLK